MIDKTNKIDVCNKTYTCGGCLCSYILKESDLPKVELHTQYCIDGNYQDLLGSKELTLFFRDPLKYGEKIETPVIRCPFCKGGTISLVQYPRDIPYLIDIAKKNERGG